MMAESVSFLSSPLGLTLAGALVALAIILWSWQFSLLVVFAVQTAVGAVTVHLSQVPVQWVLIQSAVMALSCLILAMSASKVIRSSPTARQSGSIWLRAMAVTLLYGAWRLLDITVSLPETDGNVAQLYGWLALCAVLILGLGASPLFAGVAVLLWITVIQAFVASVLEIPSLVALVGILELLVALACSYLLIAEGVQVEAEPTVLTDIAFPTQTAYADSGIGVATVTGSIGAAVGRRWPRWARNAVRAPGSSDEGSGDAGLGAPVQEDADDFAAGRDDG
ncbi:MAG: hypothetical protein ACK2UO_23000 [Caldilineaceae bacterium]